MFFETFTLGPFETNAYLISLDSKSGVLIDAPQGIAKKVQSLPLKIEAVLLTHSHQDHIAGAHALQHDLHLPLYIYPEDVSNLQKPGSDGLPLMVRVETAKPDHLLSDGQHFTIAGMDFQVIHTPGHTPGSVCFYLEKLKILFSGDTLFQGAIGNLSFPTAEPERMWKSLERIAKLPPDVKVFPGHGDPTTIGKEQWIVKARQHYGY